MSYSYRRLILVFTTLGFVSLFADVTYEGARSISGDYLAYLNAPAIVAGAVAVGEFLGYAVRLPSGLIASKYRSSRVVWLLTIVGYGLNLAIPLLALTGNWMHALAILIVERVGKGLRSPARDLIVSDLTDRAIGRGKGFAIHEVLDQLGAVSGPLIVSYAIASTRSYGNAFLWLLPSALAALTLITAAYTTYPELESFREAGARELKSYASSVRAYAIFTFLLSIGFIHWSIASYHLGKTGAVVTYIIPLLYAIAQGVDALIALPLGWLYDRRGLSTLTMLPLISAAIPPLILLSNNLAYLIVASGLYGVVLCSYETIIRAAVADLVEPQSRAAVFGAVGFLWGLAWMIGNIAGGAVYDALGPRALAIVLSAISLSSLIALKTTAPRTGASLS
ncbi:MAG: MFS transporter [Sulfolobales archaeon]|nr:MFS transporter [Sulfolobales archaeon]MCX8199240.1 MFS transporter [Sulfolobales archaeon]MDW8170446.1 MFS transporter [Desulfurococcaceae archaeon]